jgi:hypothetical protein
MNAERNKKKFGKPEGKGGIGRLKLRWLDGVHQDSTK